MCTLFRVVSTYVHVKNILFMWLCYIFIKHLQRNNTKITSNSSDNQIGTNDVYSCSKNLHFQ